MEPRSILPAHSLDRAALALALFQLALGLVLGGFHEIGGFTTEADFYGGYAPGARALAAGEPYVYARSGPGLSILLALLSLGGAADVFAAAKVVSAVALSILGLAAYAVASRGAARSCGLALQALVYVVLQRFSFVAGNDVLAAALSWAALAVLARGERPGARACLVAGLLAGASFVTRYTAVALLVAVPSALLLFVRPWRALRRVKAVVAFGTGALLAVLPWMVASQRWFGELLHHRTHGLVALDLYGPRDRYDQGALTRLEERFGSVREVLLHDPAHTLRYYAVDVVQDANQLLADAVGFPAYLTIGLGLVLLLAAPGRRPWLLGLVALFSLLGFASTALVPYQARYFYPVVPALLLPVAAAFTMPWSSLAAGRELRALRVATAAACVLVMAAGSALKTHEYLTTEPLELIGAGEALAQHARPGDAVIARKPHLGTLAGLETRGFPDGDVERVIEWARARPGTRFLYVGPSEVRQNAGLAPLACGEAVPAGLRLIHRHRAPDACLYAIE